jgi:hypothetical protein
VECSEISLSSVDGNEIEPIFVEVVAVIEAELTVRDVNPMIEIESIIVDLGPLIVPVVKHPFRRTFLITEG